MTFEEVVEENAYIDEETLEEAKHTSPLEYIRHWHAPTEEEREKGIKKGYWVYAHKEAMGVGQSKDIIVHHKDHNKHNNDPKNLMVLTRAEHCREDPNARKYTDCKVKGCKNPHYSHHLCHKHYMQAFRKGKFGNYDKSKNYSKKDR